jgi:hypothetical protein
MSFPISPNNPIRKFHERHKFPTVIVKRFQAECGTRQVGLLQNTLGNRNGALETKSPIAITINRTIFLCHKGNSGIKTTRDRLAYPELKIKGIKAPNTRIRLVKVDGADCGV